MNAAGQDPIIVVEYNPNWVLEFNNYKKRLKAALAEHILAIEHIGSTSIKSCAAKPIIDIDIVISSLSLIHI